MNPAAQVALLKDYANGLSHLHEKGIMHRDIKPENLAITSIKDPTGVILDLDGATTSKTSTDHMQGTVPYLAPEIIALKDWKPRHGPIPCSYEKSDDIWALGLSMFALWTNHHWSWRYFSLNNDDKDDRYSDTKHDLFRYRLKQVIEKPQEPRPEYKPTHDILSTFVLEMTQRAPTDRPSADKLTQNAQSAAAKISIDINIALK